MSHCSGGEKGCTPKRSHSANGSKTVAGKNIGKTDGALSCSGRREESSGKACFPPVLPMRSSYATSMLGHARRSASRIVRPSPFASAPISRIREPDAAASPAYAQRKPCLDHPPIRANGNQLANLTAGQKHLPQRNSWHVPRQLMTHPARPTPTPLGAQHGPVWSVIPAFRFPSL